MKKTQKKVTAPKKVAAQKKPARKMLIVDVPAPEVISTASTPVAIEREKTLTFPCKDCGDETDPSNRSILQDGRVLHIGCKKVKLREVSKAKPVLSGLPKHKGAKVPVKEVAPVSEYGDIQVMSDFQGRTCIQVKRDVSTVTYIPIDVTGFHLTYLPVQKFDERFRVLEKYPVKKACEHYLKYSLEYGATTDVLGYLSRVIVITEEQHNMATKKLATKGSTDSDGKSTGKKVKQAGEKRESASALFKSLIMEGKHTDDEIFKTVQDKFGLDDNKRGYVAWYRNFLKKNGQKPPEAKGKKEPAQAKGKKEAPAKKEKAPAKGKKEAPAKKAPAKKEKKVKEAAE